MSYSIWGALAETSWWIYLFFIWFALLAYQSTKPRIINFNSLAILPIIVTLFMIALLPFIISMTQFKAAVLVMAFLPGLLFGYLQFYFRGIKAIKHTTQFYLPASWSVFVILLILIMVRFYFYNYSLNFNNNFFQDEKISTIIVAICGFSIGVQLARTWCYYRCMKTGPFKT